MNPLLTDSVLVAADTLGPIPDFSQYPQLHFWAGLVLFVGFCVCVFSYVRGKMMPPPQPPPPQIVEQVVQRPVYDPSLQMWLDGVMAGVIDALKRVEAGQGMVAGQQATFREFMLEIAKDIRHGVNSHLQEHVADEERRHTHILGELSTNRNSIAEVSSCLNEIKVTLARAEGWRTAFDVTNQAQQRRNRRPRQERRPEKPEPT